ncbi:MAG: bifunctional proline dehydrogenase/L-glutamate gamma-semialdehyde dehydrogenase PutA, partial [Alphaproteobacteria bacterium]|nr:bifunctional proline dehydrogenase/L-glutamate gamma-semialdehyde dehydrogenase PutA [Alphaproteobacteria bacterium]
MIFATELAAADPARQRIRALTHADETACLEGLAAEARLTPEAARRVRATARRLVEEVRNRRPGGLDAFLHEYTLSSQEGVVLMCLAEALLRVPDAETRNLLIRDKIVPADWRGHLGLSDSPFVNASTWALMLTGRVMNEADPGGVVRRLVSRGGEPLIREALTAGMRIMGRQFVMGRTIEEALDRARPAEKRGWRHSFDMLGEAARTARDADRYMAAYANAIRAVGRAAQGRDPADAPGISVKLSALHPRFEMAQRARVMAELAPRLQHLAGLARKAGIQLCVDAEEADRLDLTLDVFEVAALDPALAGWNGLGLAVQAYQKRAPAVIDWLAGLARRANRRLPVRLVKGAYWDSEIKRAQERGLPGFPVFTRKVATDVSYIACARRLLADALAFQPQFATHNAQTLATVLELGEGVDYEFQRLHGMGETLYDQVIGQRPCRIYAPVGSHEDLLPYLVRRLLENGANTSFVNRIADADAPIESLLADPVDELAALAVKPHPAIRLPAELYAPERRNSRGIDLNDPDSLATLGRQMAEATAHAWTAGPIVEGVERGEGEGRAALDPSRRSRRV